MKHWALLGEHKKWLYPHAEGREKDPTQTTEEGHCAMCSVSVKGEALRVKTPGHVCKTWLLHFRPLYASSVESSASLISEYVTHRPCLLILTFIFNPSSKAYVKVYSVSTSALTGAPRETKCDHNTCRQSSGFTCNQIKLHTLPFFSSVLRDWME